MNFFETKGQVAIQTDFAPRAQVKKPSEEEYKAKFKLDVESVEGEAELVKQDLESLQAIETEVYNRWDMLPQWNQRYQAHIQTDKVVYRPLDVMFVEIFVFDAFSKKPIEPAQWPSTNVLYWLPSRSWTAPTTSCTPSPPPR